MLGVILKRALFEIRLNSPHRSRVGIDQSELSKLRERLTESVTIQPSCQSLSAQNFYVCACHRTSRLGQNLQDCLRPLIHARNISVSLRNFLPAGEIDKSKANKNPNPTPPHRPYHAFP